jgi:hypothetical protein
MTLAKHMNLIFKSKILYTMMENFLMKYVWNAIGMVLMALPCNLLL